MGKRLSQLVGAAILLTWGGMMIYFYVSGRITVYLAPEFRIYSLVAGLGLCVLGLFNLLTRDEDVDCGHDHGHGDDEHAHDHHERLGVIPALFLLVPLLVAAKVSPDRFNRQAIINKGAYNPNYEAAPIKEQFDLSSALAEGSAEADGTGPAEAMPETEAADADSSEGEVSAYGEYTLADLEAQVDKTDEGRYLLTIPQLFYTAGDEELQRVLKGLPVETTGQVMPEEVNNPNGTRLRAFRLFIECCAADARPLSIPIEFGDAPPEHKEMGWVLLKGKMTYLEEDGMTVPVLEVEAMQETEPPEDEMIF